LLPQDQLKSPDRRDAPAPQALAAACALVSAARRAMRDATDSLPISFVPRCRSGRPRAAQNIRTV
jgi:hypothetical protein